MISETSSQPPLSDSEPGILFYIGRWNESTNLITGLPKVLDIFAYHNYKPWNWPFRGPNHPGFSEQFNYALRTDIDAPITLGVLSEPCVFKINCNDPLAHVARLWVKAMQVGIHEIELLAQNTRNEEIYFKTVFRVYSNPGRILPSAMSRIYRSLSPK